MDWEISLRQTNSQAIAYWDPSLGSAINRADNSDRFLEGTMPRNHEWDTIIEYRIT